MAICRGILYGLLTTGFNYLLVYLSTKSILKKDGNIKIVFYFAVSFLRYLLFGVFIFLFLKFKLGSPLGLIIGVTVVVIGYTVTLNSERHKQRP